MLVVVVSAVFVVVVFVVWFVASVVAVSACLSADQVALFLVLRSWILES